MSDEVRIPDIEVIVGCAGDDVAVFGFYLRSDVHQGYEVVSAVSGKAARPVIGQILQDAITALNTATWFTMDELHEDAAEEEDQPPF